MQVMGLGIAALLAALCAGVMGFAIQRGATCTVAAVDEWLRLRKARRLLAMGEASLWVAGGLALASAGGWLPAMPAVYPVSGWVLLGVREPHEIAFGLVGKFWRPVIEFARVASAAEFQAFAEPGFAKTIYALSVTPVDRGRTLLSGTMRTATTDEHARRWFRRYWTLGVGSGAHLVVHGLLDVAREHAEQAVEQYA